jgi:hypothetical protein
MRRIALAAFVGILIAGGAYAQFNGCPAGFCERPLQAIAPPPPPPAGCVPNVTGASSAQCFVNAFGADVHMYYGGGYGNVSNVVADLAYIGAKTIRDCGFNAANNAPPNAYTALAAAGISFDFEICTGTSGGIASLINAYHALAVAFPGSMATVEGPNEINNFTVQYSQSAQTSAATAAGSAVLNFSPTPPAVVTAANSGWGSFPSLGPGVTVTSNAIPVGTTVAAATPATVTLNANTTGNINPGDTIIFAASGANQSVGWAASGAAMQQQLDTASHADSALSSVPVTNLTTCCTPWGHAGAFDQNNTHSYSGFGYPPLRVVKSPIADFSVVPRLPAWVTETGFYTNPTNDGSGLDPLTAARYALESFFDFWNLGISRWYIYELIDESGPPAWGLFTNTNVAKTSATAIHNLNGIMADAGAAALTFTPTTLPYSVVGMPPGVTPDGNNFSQDYGGHSLQFQKSNGAYEIAIWYEQNLWNNGTHLPRTPLTSPITVNFGGIHGTVNVYDPVVGSTPVQAFSNVSSVNLTLGADLLIVEVIN